MASLVAIMATVQDVAIVSTLTLDHLVTSFALFMVSARTTPSAWTHARALQDGSLTCRGSPAALQTVAPTTATEEAAARIRSVFALMGLRVHFVRSDVALRIVLAMVHALMVGAHAPLVTWEMDVMPSRAQLSAFMVSVSKVNASAKKASLVHPVTSRTLVVGARTEASAIQPSLRLMISSANVQMDGRACTANTRTA